jgi:hypothetical protein
MTSVSQTPIGQANRRLATGKMRPLNTADRVGCASRHVLSCNVMSCDVIALPHGPARQENKQAAESVLVVWFKKPLVRRHLRVRGEINAAAGRGAARRRPRGCVRRVPPRDMSRTGPRRSSTRGARLFAVGHDAPRSCRARRPLVLPSQRGVSMCRRAARSVEMGRPVPLN